PSWILPVFPGDGDKAVGFRERYRQPQELVGIVFTVFCTYRPALVGEGTVRITGDFHRCNPAVGSGKITVGLRPSSHIEVAVFLHGQLHPAFVTNTHDKLPLRKVVGESRHTHTSTNLVHGLTGFLQMSGFGGCFCKVEDHLTETEQFPVRTSYYVVITGGRVEELTLIITGTGCRPNSSVNTGAGLTCPGSDYTGTESLSGRIVLHRSWLFREAPPGITA